MNLIKKDCLNGSNLDVFFINFQLDVIDNFQSTALFMVLCLLDYKSSCKLYHHYRSVRGHEVLPQRMLPNNECAIIKLPVKQICDSNEKQKKKTGTLILRKCFLRRFAAVHICRLDLGQGTEIRDLSTQKKIS